MPFLKGIFLGENLSSHRGEFKTSIGFILATAGSAIGLGNIWQFPSQTAENGGAAFVFVYLILTFVLAYPVLMAELIIGRYSRLNILGAYQKLSPTKHFSLAGYWAIICAGLILAFYAIIAGQMLSFVFEAFFNALGFTSYATWVTENSVIRNILFTTLFYILTISIVLKGIQSGIETWASKLMPSLILILIGLIIYVATQNGASIGFKKYLIPDFSKVIEPQLLLSAMGQGFFSLSVGVGGILAYGSYMSHKENIVKIGAYVTLADICVAFLAGLLIIPAMYVASSNGIEIFTESGVIKDGKALIFNVLPELFKTMGSTGIFVSFIFFILMTIAALTSSISMLEGLVAFGIDNKNMTRKNASYLFSGIVLIISIILVLNFNTLFGFIVTLTSKYSLPILATVFCIFVGWIVRQNDLLEEIRKGYPNADEGLFFKLWPLFMRIVCPALILLVFWQTL